jgi:pimeloyl-ACP methyl ester carboxylesterase
MTSDVSTGDERLTMPDDPVAALGPDVSDHRLTRPDGRIVAWSESGVAGGRPILRIPGTPGSRLSLRADRTPWIERGLRMIATERPGYGASTRLEGRGFKEHADDLVAILDALKIERLPVYGGSGAAPHILALAARHPSRVSVATVLVGAAPVDEDEADQMIELNALAYRLHHEGRFDELWKLTSDVQATIVADPVGALRGIMASAEAEDRRIVEDPGWQRSILIGIGEALRPGPGGWYDEGLAMENAWDFDPADVATDVTWWHSDDDRNSPLSAARRLVERLPSARLHVWSKAGHLAPYLREPEILDELLARVPVR